MFTISASVRGGLKKNSGHDDEMIKRRGEEGKKGFEMKLRVQRCSFQGRIARFFQVDESED